jgi:hypothetical protein
MSLKKLDNKFEKYCKKKNINSEALILGLIFFVCFWIVLDSVLLGVMFGAVMYIAFNEENKRKNSKDKSSKNK